MIVVINLLLASIAFVIVSRIAEDYISRPLSFLVGLLAALLVFMANFGALLV